MICRFTYHIVERISTRIVGKPAIGKAYLAKGLKLLVQRLVFLHADFQLTAHDTMRLSTIVDKLAKEGKLTIGH